jgi:SAM-dependent methyltransferase
MVEQAGLSWEDAVRWLRGQPDQAELVRDCFYDDPLMAAAARYYGSTEWRALRHELPETRGIALDIGAGRGISSFALAQDGWDVVSLEPDASDLVGRGAIQQLADDADIDLKIVSEWGESLPFGAAHFDLVYCRAALHHARDLALLCREIARVLKPGGRLVATREHVISKEADLDVFLRGHPLHRLYGGEKAYRLDTYQQAISQAGLTLLKTINPFQSDVNMFPQNRELLRANLAAKLKIPAFLIPQAALDCMGHLIKTPGRLYSFTARKER